MSSSESTLAASNQAPLTRYVPAKSPVATSPARKLPVARRTMSTISASAIRLARKDTNRNVGNDSPVTRASSPVIQK